MLLRAYSVNNCEGSSSRMACFGGFWIDQNGYFSMVPTPSFSVRLTPPEMEPGLRVKGQRFWVS